MTQNYVIAANMSINNGDPYTAAMFYENINMLLPPATDRELVEDSDNNSKDSENNNPEYFDGAEGYRLDINTFKPNPVDKHGTKSYVTQSLKSDLVQWEYLSVLSGKVMEAIGKFAAANKGEI